MANTPLYKNKYRIPSARWQGWDYSADATYFVTICTKSRFYYFGDILDGQMQLSEIGRQAENCWQQIPVYYPFVCLAGFVVMPNHVHGIVVINKTGWSNVETQYFASPVCIVTKTRGIASLRFII